MKKYLFIFISGLLFGNCAFAGIEVTMPPPAPVATNYSTEVQVSDYSDNVRNQAFIQGLQQVLPKGTDAAKISNPSSLVQSYSYTTHPAAKGQQALFLQIQFSKQLPVAAPPVVAPVVAPVGAPTTALAPASVVDPNQVILRVVGINGLSQYEEIVKYLRAFNQITQVDIQSVSGNEMQLKVICNGGKQALINVLSVQKQLVPDTGNAAVPAGVDLNYKWAV